MESPIGNIELLKKRRIGFLAPSHVAPLAVLPTLDWAAQMAQREDVAVMSGFSSQTEKDVLSFLCKGKCGIILVLARCHYKQLPEDLLQLLNTERLLIISTSTLTRQCKKTAYQRNKYICEHADLVFVPTPPVETSNLFVMLREHNNVKYIDNSLIHNGQDNNT